jgi:phosphate-selective porin OprO/OprP
MIVAAALLAASLQARPDSAVELHFHGYVQVDARSGAPTSTVLLRRVRPVFEATLYRTFAVRIMPDFGQGATKLYDAYGDIRLWPALAIRAGKFKPPIGLERLQSATDLHFVERGLPHNLVPNRDVGVQIFGDLPLLASRLSYQLGVFNGVPDLGFGDGDATSSKDLVGRLFAFPLSSIDFGVGVAASAGQESGSATSPQLATYLTPGQQAFFRYRLDALADGARKRLAPQAYLNTGSIGLLAEYTRTTQRVRRAAALGTIRATAYQLEASWLLTGERNSFRSISPKRIFDSAAGTWGALEATARIGALSIDDTAFPTFADPVTATKSVRAWAVGLNWHLAPKVKIVTDYERSSFDNRSAETFIVSRIQTAF